MHSFMFAKVLIYICCFVSCMVRSFALFSWHFCFIVDCKKSMHTYKFAIILDCIFVVLYTVWYLCLPCFLGTSVFLWIV